MHAEVFVWNELSVTYLEMHKKLDELKRAKCIGMQ